MEHEYNGWTNYATWRIALEMFDGFDVSEYYETYKDDHFAFGDYIEDWTNQLIIEPYPEGLAKDYACAFLEEVYWHEIAEHLIKDYEYELNALNENNAQGVEDETV